MRTLSTAQEIDEHLRADAGRAIVCGTLERVSMGKGRKTWLGTAIVTDDGEVVWVSYGAPPEGWESLLGSFLRVEGVFAMTKSTTEQSLIAPHLLSFGTPTVEQRPLPTLEGKLIRVVGVAQNTAPGRVVLVEQQPVSVGSDAWPEGTVGKRVSLGGTLRRQQHGWSLDDVTDATAF